MALSPALSTLLDDARAEAKRSGGSAASLPYLAAALARRHPLEFEKVFGPAAAVRLQTILARTPHGPETETIEVLQGAGSDDPLALLTAVKARLGTLADGDGDRRANPANGASSQMTEDAGPSSPPAQPIRRAEGFLAPIEPDPSIVGFESLVEYLVALLSQRIPATPLVCGPAGSGKSAVAAALAHRLRGKSIPGVSAITGVVTAAVLADNPIAGLDRALDAQRPDEIVVVDDLESLLSLGSSAAILPMFARLRASASDPTRRLLLLIDSAYTSRLEAIDQELTSVLTVADMPSLSTERLWEIAREQGTLLARHHGVELSDEVIRLAAAPRSRTDRLSHPGLLSQRLDLACARAALRDDRRVRDEDIGLAATSEVAPLQVDALVAAIRRRVRGQDEALATIAARLALTRAQLDLRPERPDGVFLFVGPTGVGKTELARALCEQLFGEEQRLIRLDMSEYAEEWALSRLIGPQPGYVGFTEPESWLTTRIRRQPETVLLLDEIEKAHPSVWNAFLQVFDAGRLSDSRGNAATFERTVIVMTSNLGASVFASPPVGFAPVQDDLQIAARDSERLLEKVRETLPIELVNRLDEIVVFRPLTEAVIEEIARLEIDRMRTRLAERGYALAISDEVVKLVARTGYDPAFGARHLQRNVERLLLEPLAVTTGRQLAAEVRDDTVVWRAS